MCREPVHIDKIYAKAGACTNEMPQIHSERIANEIRNKFERVRYKNGERHGKVGRGPW